jgi:hypothetical protein
MKTRLFTVRDEKNAVVAGLENVSEDNALVSLSKVVYDMPLAELDVGQTAHGSYGTGKNREQYFTTRTA